MRTLNRGTLKDFLVTTLLNEGRNVDAEWIDATLEKAMQATSPTAQFDVLNKELGRLYGPLHLA